MTDPANKPVRKHLSEVDLAVLAQVFYEASGIRLYLMTGPGKEAIIEGLRATFERVGMPVDKRLVGPSLTVSRGNQPRGK